jgi:glycolate oxidase iron-sulfur subunit
VSHDLDSRLDTLLRSCIECGLCLPHCATYLASGNEALSPRGRLLLLRHAGTTPLDPAVRASFDLCLGCRACVTACPSGIVPELLDHLRTLAAPRAGWAGPVPVSALDRPRVLSLVKQAVTVARGMARTAAGVHWRRRLAHGPALLRGMARLLGTLPTSPDHDAELLRQLDLLGGQPAASVAAPVRTRSEPLTGGPVVALFTGCADGALLPGTARRLRDLLVAAGCRIHDVPRQDCCGALAAHTGRPHRAAHLRARNQAAFAPHLAACDHVVVAAAGCGQELSSHPEVLAGKAIDAVVLLSRLPSPVLQAVPLRVAVHDPCHARHARGILAEPRSLLARIPGLELVEPAEAEVCCGGAGAYALRHPDSAEAMGRRKAEALAATGCDLVVTTNSGCLGQIADALAMVAPGVPILPLTDLIWYAWRRKIPS